MIKYLISIGIVASLAAFNHSSEDLWLTDWDTAMELSAQEGKPIFLVFSGSDWCGPCIRQKAEIFKTDDFKAFAAENLILVNADFPRRKKNRLPEDLTSQNKDLAEQYNPKGYFPYNLLISPDGKILGSCSYRAGGPAPFIKLLKKWQNS